MAVTATVTRTELGLAALALQDATYGIIQDSLDLGQVAWRRELATSPFAAGALEVGAVQEQGSGSLLVKVTGSSHSDLQSKVSTLVSAFKQASYTLTVNFDATAYAWSCQRADYSLTFDVPMRQRYIARVALTFPRSPIASSGPI